MSQDRLRAEAVVETSFPNKDARRAENFARAIQGAATATGALGGSEGRAMSENSLTFVMEAAQLSQFIELVAANCSRLRPARDELKTRVSVKIG